MKVIIDGVEHDVKNDVKVIYEDMGPVGGDQLHITLTHEGVVTDVTDGEDVIGTSSIETEDVYETLMSGNSPLVSRQGETYDPEG